MSESSSNSESGGNHGAFTSDRIAQFWNEHPCGQDLIPGDGASESFFRKYDDYKYATEPHIPANIGALSLRGKKVLEIGTGQGAESQRLIESGAEYYGIDLTEESIHRVKTRLDLFGLPYRQLQVMNAENLAFPDECFDLVFSHGVIHHSPRIDAIVAQIRRVLKPGGQAVVMLYHRHSVNYHLSVRVLRRLGVFLLFVPGVAALYSRGSGEPPQRLARHKLLLKQRGLAYLKMESFIHKATDGPENVYSAVFSRTEARALFSRFTSVGFSCHFLNERHLPIIRRLLPRALKAFLEARLGWHLWVYAEK